MASDDVVVGLGRPWTVVATYPEYGPAHTKAEELRAKGDAQVKVKHIAAGYTVRTRKEVASTPAEQSSAAQSKTRMKAKDRRAKESETEE